MHLNRKGITSENFCCVCFSKIKTPYILTKPCNFPCPFSNLKFSFLRPCNFLETYRGNRWAQNQYLLDTGENVPQLPHSLRECLSVVMTFYFRNDENIYFTARIFYIKWLQFQKHQFLRQTARRFLPFYGWRLTQLRPSYRLSPNWDPFTEFDPIETLLQSLTKLIPSYRVWPNWNPLAEF